jgi:hypothetical protein
MERSWKLEELATLVKVMLLVADMGNLAAKELLDREFPWASESAKYFLAHVSVFFVLVQERMSKQESDSRDTEQEQRGGIRPGVDAQKNFQIFDVGAKISRRDSIQKLHKYATEAEMQTQFIRTIELLEDARSTRWQLSWSQILRKKGTIYLDCLRRRKRRVIIDTSRSRR